jgi:hypothetical protein
LTRLPLICKADYRTATIKFEPDALKTGIPDAIIQQKSARRIVWRSI